MPQRNRTQKKRAKSPVPRIVVLQSLESNPTFEPSRKRGKVSKAVAEARNGNLDRLRILMTDRLARGDVGPGYLTRICKSARINPIKLLTEVRDRARSESAKRAAEGLLMQFKVSDTIVFKPPGKQPVPIREIQEKAVRSLVQALRTEGMSLPELRHRAELARMKMSDLVEGAINEAPPEDSRAKERALRLRDELHGKPSPVSVMPTSSSIGSRSPANFDPINRLRSARKAAAPAKATSSDIYASLTVLERRRKLTDNDLSAAVKELKKRGVFVSANTLREIVGRRSLQPLKPGEEG